MINFTICTYDLLHLYIYMLSLCGFVLVYVARFILPFYTFRYTSYLLMLWHKLFSLKIEKDLFFMALSIVTHLLTKQGISVNVFLVIQILSKKQRLISSILRIFEMVKPIYYIVKIILNQMNLAMVYVTFVFWTHCVTPSSHLQSMLNDPLPSNLICCNTFSHKSYE